MKFLTPVLLICLAGGLFYWFIKPTYAQVKTLQEERKVIQATLEEARQAVERKNQLMTVLRSFPKSDLDRLEKFLPDSIDNITLIMNLNSIAARYGSSIKDIKMTDPSATRGQAAGAQSYSTLEMGFNVDMTYERFAQFLEEVQANLRLVDIHSITFKPGDSNVYTYSVGLRAYWLN